MKKKKNPSGSIMALRSTKPLTEMSTKNISWGVKVAGAYGWQPYHLHVPNALKSGSLNHLGTSGPVQACNGIAFLYHLLVLVPAAMQSKAHIYSHSPVGIVGSNPTEAMDVCLLWVLCVCQEQVFASGRLLVQTSSTKFGVSEWSQCPIRGGHDLKSGQSTMEGGVGSACVGGYTDYTE
jgi:hypothetical protein